MNDFGVMVFFDFFGGIFKMVNKVLVNIYLFIFVESLGGVESFIGYLVSMIYVFILKEDCFKVGFIDSFICFSVGVEDVDDFIVDLEEVFWNV